MPSTLAALAPLVLAALALTPVANGHACVIDPPARRAPSGPYSLMCSSSSYELSSGNCNGGGGIGCRASQLNADTSVCGGPFQDNTWNPLTLPFNPQRSYSAGSTITLSVYYRVVHTSGRTPGWVEASLCTRGSSLTQSCFDQYRLTAVGGSGLRHTVPNTQQPWTSASYTFQLPAGVSCSQCVVQYVWQTSSWDGASGEQFHNCADITISGGSGPPSVPTPDPSPSPSPNPSPNPSPSPSPNPSPSPSTPAGGCDPNSVCSTAGAQPAPCGCSSDCSQFVNCAHGSGILQPCGAGLVFNPAGYCDWPYNYACPC